MKKRICPLCKEELKLGESICPVCGCDIFEYEKEVKNTDSEIEKVKNKFNKFLSIDEPLEEETLKTLIDKWTKFLDEKIFNNIKDIKRILNNKNPVKEVVNSISKIPDIEYDKAEVKIPVYQKQGDTKLFKNTRELIETFLKWGETNDIWLYFVGAQLRTISEDCLRKKYPYNEEKHIFIDNLSNIYKDILKDCNFNDQQKNELTKDLHTRHAILNLFVHKCDSNTKGLYEGFGNRKNIVLFLKRTLKIYSELPYKLFVEEEL